jgi:hypothetical protein
MSMFTPPGEGARPPGRRSGARRTAITLTVAILLLAGAVAVAWQYLLREDDSEGTTTAVSACPSAPATPGTASAPPDDPAAAPAPRRVRANVYNATKRSGLAGTVGDELKERGFRVRRVANDPLKRKVPGTAEVRHGRKGAAAAKTLAAQVDGATLVLDRRTGPAVDLVLGEKFTKLATPEKAAAALDPAPAPAPQPTGC